METGIKHKVLVAEDDVILREILLGKLTTAGHIGIGAEDGNKAIEIWKREQPDLVLLDIILPGKSGLDVLREMRQDTAYAKTPVLAISNSDDAESIRETKELGVHDFLIKAIFDSSDVIDKVNQILRNPAPVSTPPAPAAPVATTGLPMGAVPASSPRADASVAGKKRILIVEDDRFLREIATQKLEAESFLVEAATNGKEALDYLEKSARPDIVVLDLILPGISGFEVLEKIKSNPQLKVIPVLILSNLGQEEDIQKATKLGAADYLVKAHFSFAEIIKKIREIIG